jgi:mRNA-degrading endonuclease RelE of RelBE toxin-antitoxin system
MGTSSKRYEVLLTSAVKKDLKRLRSHKARIGEALGELETNPLAGHTLKGTLTGLRSLGFTVKGSGAFRAVYAVIDDEAVCLVIIVGPHENIYEAAERRVESLRAAGEL